MGRLAANQGAKAPLSVAPRGSMKHVSRRRADPRGRRRHHRVPRQVPSGPGPGMTATSRSGWRRSAAGYAAAHEAPGGFLLPPARHQSAESQFLECDVFSVTPDFGHHCVAVIPPAVARTTILTHRLATHPPSMQLDIPRSTPHSNCGRRAYRHPLGESVSQGTIHRIHLRCTRAHDGAEGPRPRMGQLRPELTPGQAARSAGARGSGRRRSIVACSYPIPFAS